MLPAEHASSGRPIVAVFSILPDMPKAGEQPEYYALLGDLGSWATNFAISVFVAASAASTLLGSIHFISDMKRYGSGGTLAQFEDPAGIRLLAVDPACRPGRGVGKALTDFCIKRGANSAEPGSCCTPPAPWRPAWSMY